MIKKMMIVTLISILVIVVFEVIRTEMNPLSRSEEEIKIHLLKETPLGTVMEDVVHYIEMRSQWELRSINDNNGYQSRNPSEIVGEKSIRVFMGDYRHYPDLYFTTSVTVFYGFNEKSELIDIRVWKDVDTL